MDNTAGHVIIPSPGYLAGNWTLDPTDSEIEFSVRSLGAKVRGRLALVDAALRIDQDPSKSSITAILDPASLDTGNAKRDRHLRSAAYLDVSKHPAITYRSTAIRGEAGLWIVEGVLSMRGVTAPVPMTVDVPRFGSDVDGSGGPATGRRARFCAAANVNRGAFGLARYSGGGVLSSRKATIRLNVTAVLQG
jgi:polyisoprenoid-binding protein YceI